MKVTLRNATMIVLTACLAGATHGAPVAAQEEGAELKGVYREGQRTGVKVVVYRGQGEGRRRVPTDYEFKSGDGFDLELETNQRAYVYVLNRTLVGNPDQLSSKGIDRVRDDDRRDRTGKRARYKLLYPLGNDAKVTSANKKFQISGFKMDNQPGVEKMMVVVSAKPVDLSKYFDVDGNQRTRRGRASGSEGDSGRHTDSEEDVLDQLNKDLSDWAANAESSLPKGVTRDPEGVGVVRNGDRPGMVELTLRHYGR
jgi:hypothetical protein